MSVSWHAATFMAAAARGQADPGQDPQAAEEVGRRLWRLVFDAQAGQPAVILTGRAGPEVTQIALIQDGREDRRSLESHFGAWVVCTERLKSFQVAGLAGDGTVLARVGWTGGPG